MRVSGLTPLSEDAWWVPSAIFEVQVWTFLMNEILRRFLPPNPTVTISSRLVPSRAELSVDLRFWRVGTFRALSNIKVAEDLARPLRLHLQTSSMPPNSTGKFRVVLTVSISRLEMWLDPFSSLIHNLFIL